MKRYLFSICLMMFSFATFAQLGTGIQNVVLEKYYISDATDNSVAGVPVGSTTYRIWVKLTPGWKFQAAYGNASHSLNLQTSTSFYNDADHGSTTPNGFSAVNLAKKSLMIDSWVSVGAAGNGKIGVRKSADTDGAIANVNAMLQNADPAAGTAIKVKDGILPGSPSATSLVGISTELDVLGDGTTTGNQVLITNGSWASLSGVTDSLVLIAQITTNGDFSYDLNLKVQNTTTLASEYWVSSSPAAGEFTAAFLHHVPNQLPVVSLTSPAGGSSYQTGDAVNMAATATDPDGTISKVEFFVDGTKVGEDLTSPYSFSWTSTVGSHSLTAVATDDAGDTKTSSPVSIQVGPNTPPTVTITNPTNGQSLVMGSTVAIAATATDPGGSVASVQFFVNGTSIGTDNSSPFSFNWTAVVGTAVITAVATDNGGLSTTSSPVTVSVPDTNKYYAVQSFTGACNETNFCLPVSGNSVTGVIGYDITLFYNKQKVTPSGIITVDNDLLTNPLLASYSTNILNISNTPDTIGKMLISIYLNASAPAGTTFHGTGTLFCAEFSRTANLGSQESAYFSVSSLVESYMVGVATVTTHPGKYTSTRDNTFSGSIKFWNGYQAMPYNPSSPSQYLVTKIFGTADSLTYSTTPDLTGVFSYITDHGNQITINRDIDVATSVMSVINGQDALLTKKVLIDDLSFIPNVFQIIAMDVNMDGYVTAGDLTQINMRTIGKINEFHQAWNNGTSKKSKDWLFVDNASLNNQAYNISISYPGNDGNGYSKYKVPAYDHYKTLPISDPSGCPVISDAIYQGVLLGDVDGNYKAYVGSVGTGLKGAEPTSDDQVVFHMENAVAADGYLSVPVSVSASGEVHALDFELNFNNSDFTFESVVPAMQQMEVNAEMSVADATLRLTSFSTMVYPSSTSVFILKFKVENVNADLNLIPVTSYTNGEPAKSTVLESTTAIGTVAENAQFDVRPNPSCGMLFVTVKSDATVEMLNACGQIVIEKTKVKASQATEFNVSGLADGVYFMKVQNGNTATTKKVVVKK